LLAVTSVEPATVVVAFRVAVPVSNAVANAARSTLSAVVAVMTTGFVVALIVTDPIAKQIVVAVRRTLTTVACVVPATTMHAVWVAPTVADPSPRTICSTNRRRGCVSQTEGEKRSNETEDHELYIAKKNRINA
jgi:hypothetical protein